MENNTSGTLFWTSKDKINKMYPYVAYNLNCDVLVIGGGISGAIMAYYLAKENMNVVIVDKNIIGYGSTAACMARVSMDMNIEKVERNFGREKSEKFYLLCKEAMKEIQKIDAEVNEQNSRICKKNMVYFSNGISENQKLKSKFKHLKEKEGLENIVKLIKKNKRNSGEVQKDILNSKMKIVVESSNESEKNNALGYENAIEFDPYIFTTRLINYLNNKYNVRVFENTEICSIKDINDTVTCIAKNGFKIFADKVVLASNTDTLKYINTDKIELHRTYNLVTSKVNELEEQNAEFNAKDVADNYHYMRFTEDGRIIFGGENVKITNKMNDEKYCRYLTKNKYDKLYTSLDKTLDIQVPKIDYAYNGTMIEVTDGLPIVAELDNMPNCFCNIGSGDDTILFNTVGAKLIKDAVKGLYPKEFEMFRIDR